MPTPLEQARDGRLQVWFPPPPGKEYIVAVDPAGGGAEATTPRCRSSSCQRHAVRRAAAAAAAVAKLAHAPSNVAREYSTPGGPALIVVERNNHGFGVLAHLEQRALRARVRDRTACPAGSPTRCSKPAIVAAWTRCWSEHPELFRSKRLLEECRTFVTHPNGRTGAASGAHDDCVMAMAIAQSCARS